MAPASSGRDRGFAKPGRLLKTAAPLPGSSGRDRAQSRKGGGLGSHLRHQLALAPGELLSEGLGVQLGADQLGEKLFFLFP